MSVYINRLKQASEQAQASHDCRTIPESKFDRWWAGQPKATRQRPYSMSELAAQIGVASNVLTFTLTARGWTRSRKWQNKAHYYRLWTPPKE